MHLYETPSVLTEILLLESNGANEAACGTQGWLCQSAGWVLLGALGH